MDADDEVDRHGGRRHYDRLIDPVIETFVEARLRETRHEFRNEIAALATLVSNGRLEQAEEQTAVRAELRELHKDLAGLRDDLKPMRENMVTLQRNDDRQSVQAQTRDELLDKLDRHRKWMVGTSLAVCGVMMGTVGLFLSHV